VAWERHIPEPMLDVRLFRNMRFTAASLSVTLVMFSLMGVLFFLTQYLQGVLGLSAIETGLRFIPLAIGIVASAPVSAALTKATGADTSPKRTHITLIFNFLDELRKIAPQENGAFWRQPGATIRPNWP